MADTADSKSDSVFPLIGDEAIQNSPAIRNSKRYKPPETRRFFVLRHVAPKPANPPDDSSLVQLMGVD